MHIKAYKVVDGVVYDTRTAQMLHYNDRLFTGRKILSVTPEGNHFITMNGGVILGWVIFPYSRLRSVEWALENNAPNHVLTRLGVNILPQPPESDAPYDIRTGQPLGSRKRLFGYDFLFKNQDGRLFLYERMTILGFLTEKSYPMTQQQALLWAIKHISPWITLQDLGYIREYPKPHD